MCRTDVLSSDAEWLTSLMQRRHTTLPRYLEAPAPNAVQMACIYGAATTAPDHGQVRPWRLVEIPAAQREFLADVFEGVQQDKDSRSTAEDLARARNKALQSPMLILAILNQDETAQAVNLMERTLSLGCALQNMLLTATALGFGSSLTSGDALHSPRLKAFFSLAPSEHAACFINLGKVSSPRPAKPRPLVSALVSQLQTRSDLDG